MAVTPPTILAPVSFGRNGSGVAGNSITFAHTVPAGTEALIIFITWDTFFVDPPNQPVVTWLGVTVDPINLAGSSVNKSTLALAIQPTVGSGNIVVTGSPAHGTSLAAVAINIKDFAAIRWSEDVWVFGDDQIQARIYSDPTDLLINFAMWINSGTIITPTVGQTVLMSYSGTGDSGCKLAASQVNAPVAVGNPAVEANYTEAGWTASVVTNLTQSLLTIKGLDRAAPANASPSIARVSETLTLEQQPPSAIVSVANIGWKWRHEVPVGFETLVVLITYFDTLVTAVYYRPDGGAEIALTQLVQSNAAGCWVLESAPVGLGYMRVVMDRIRWYGASAYSISGSGLNADVFRGGVDPTFMRIDTVPGSLVVDRVGQLNSIFQNWTAFVGQASFYVQPLYGAGNSIPPILTATGGSNQGASSWTTAIGNLTTMSWTPAPPAGTFSQAGFSFLGSIPPPPGGEGCPNPLNPVAVDGTGCPSPLNPVSADGSGCGLVLAPPVV